MGVRTLLTAAVMAAMVAGTACTKTSADDAKRNANAAVDAGKVAADKLADAATATGAAVSDGWITTKLKAKFADEVGLKGSDITVDTKAHVVTLTGTVLSATARTRAVEIANGTEGVKRVVDGLVVR